MHLYGGQGMSLEKQKKKQKGKVEKLMSKNE